MDDTDGIRTGDRGAETDDTREPYAADDPAGRTHGSAQRPAHQVVAPLLAVDLPMETAQLYSEENWRQARHNAKTLVKRPDLRVVLIALGRGERMDKHRAPAPISIHTLDGRLRLRVGARAVDLPAGHVLVLEPDAPHDVEAVEESVFLLTIAWPAPY